MTNIEIVVKLYEECVKQLSRSLNFIDEKDYTKTNAALMKSWEIINALRSVLDMSIPISKDLDNLYDYFGKEILRGNMKKDRSVIAPLIPLVSELEDAFRQISNMPKRGSTVKTNASVSADPSGASDFGVAI